MTTNTSNLFSIADYKSFDKLPFELLDQLNYAVYVIDYSWIYKFINKHGRETYGELAEKLIGQSALTVFSDKRFEQIFSAIKEDVDRKLAIHTIVESPLRGSQVILKGQPLDDCYYFSSTIVPAKIEVLNDLREQLNLRKRNA